MIFVLFSYFTHMEGHIAYMQSNHASSQKYFINTLPLHKNVSLYYCMFFNQLVRSLTKEALHRLAPTLSLRKTIIIYDTTLCREWCDFMQGMSYFGQKKSCCTRHVLEDFDLKTNFKAMLKLVCWFYPKALAVVYFLPWFQVTFWEGAQTRMISMRCDWVDMGQPLMDLHWFVFFHWVLDMLGRSCENLGNTSHVLQCQCCLHIALLLWHPTHYAKPEKKSMEEVLFFES